LASDGYTSLTTDKIADHARVSKSTIYRRWPTKEHMVLAAFDRTAPLEAVDTGSVERDLLSVVEQFVRLLLDTPLGGALPALMVERLHNPTLAAALDPIVNRRREPAKFILERAVARGELAAALDTELALDLIWGPVILRALFIPGDVSREGLVSLVRAVLLALGRPSPAKPSAGSQ
jgi:AcrR family transcriptional regulator